MAGSGDALTLSSWLLRIATNLTLNHIRSMRRRREQPMAVDPGHEAESDADDTVPPGWMIDASADPPDEGLIRDERRRLLQAAVAALSHEKQEIVRMVYYDRMETRQVASELGIPHGTVKSRLHHARRDVARAWSELGLNWEDV